LTYWQLCAVAIVQMVARMAFDSAGIAQLRTLVPQPHRAEANGRFETTLWTANTIGPATDGALISWLSATATMALDEVSFLASALAAATTPARLQDPEPEPPPRQAQHHWTCEFTAGWRYTGVLLISGIGRNIWLFLSHWLRRRPSA
jgi:hypothetical protein